MYKYLNLLIITFTITTVLTYQIQADENLSEAHRIQTSIDAKGKIVTPFILYKVVKAFDTIELGNSIEIHTDIFEGIENDIKSWCQMTGNTLLLSEQKEGFHKYLIRKEKVKENDKQLTMVISNSGFEELLSPLGFALSAALSGIDVTIYFQGPAVRVLKKGFKEKLQGFNRIFSGFARKGAVKTGHIAAQDKLRQLKELGAKFLICHASMDYFKVSKGDLIFEDIVLAEYFTLIKAMGNSNIQVFLQ